MLKFHIFIKMISKVCIEILNMSFLKDIIGKAKQQGFGSAQWVKRADKAREQEEQEIKEREELENKRKQKEMEKLRELSYGRTKRLGEKYAPALIVRNRNF